MIHLWLPMAVAATLAGAGVYGILARRNAVLVLVGVELVLNAANLVLVALGARGDAATAATGGTAATTDVSVDPALSTLQTGQTLTLFVITIAAAEICVALAIVLAMFRLQGHIDLAEPASTEDTPVAPDPHPTSR